MLRVGGGGWRVPRIGGGGWRVLRGGGGGGDDVGGDAKFNILRTTRGRFIYDSASAKAFVFIDIYISIFLSDGLLTDEKYKI